MSTPLAPDPSLAAPELPTLRAFLDYFRSVMVRKVEGVDGQGLRFSPVPTGTSLGGLIKHLGFVERYWFQVVWAGRDVEFPWTEDDPDADFRLDGTEDAAGLVAFYRAECDEANTIIDTATPDDVVASRRGDLSLRWILIHMIEETARHAGHADILREMIDGATGD